MTKDACPAWDDGQHLYQPGYMGHRTRTIVDSPFRETPLVFKALAQGDRIDAKRCACGKVVKLKKAAG